MDCIHTERDKFTFKVDGKTRLESRRSSCKNWTFQATSRRVSPGSSAAIGNTQNKSMFAVEEVGSKIGTIILQTFVNFWPSAGGGAAHLQLFSEETRQIENHCRHDTGVSPLLFWFCEGG